MSTGQSPSDMIFSVTESNANEADDAGGEAMRINSLRNILMGITVYNNTMGGVAPKLQIENTGHGNSSMSVFRNGDHASPPYLMLGASRGASVGSNTIVADDDEMGEISFIAADGTDRISRCALISAFIDGTPGANDTPGRLVFATTADGYQAPTDRLSILASGLVHVAGELTAGTKTFRIHHPLPDKKDTHDLVHSCIEAPRADLIYRSKVDLSGGYAQVDLDEASGLSEGTWELLCRDPQCWIQNDTGWGAVRGSVEGNTLTITCAESDSDDTVSWMVCAERHDESIKIQDNTDDAGRLIVEPEARRRHSRNVYEEIIPEEVE